MSERKPFPWTDQFAERQRPIACDQVNVADLNPLRYPRDYRIAASGAEPDRDDLVGLLRAGLPNSVVVSDPAAVIGANPVAAAVREPEPVAGDASDALRGSRCETAGVRS